MEQKKVMPEVPTINLEIRGYDSEPASWANPKTGQRESFTRRVLRCEMINSGAAVVVNVRVSKEEEALIVAPAVWVQPAWWVKGARVTVGVKYWEGTKGVFQCTTSPDCVLQTAAVK